MGLTIRFDTRSADDYRKFLAVRKLPMTVERAARERKAEEARATKSKRGVR